MSKLLNEGNLKKTFCIRKPENALESPRFYALQSWLNASTASGTKLAALAEKLACNLFVAFILARMTHLSRCRLYVQGLGAVIRR
jgi:hypothetical protein